jgi:Leucine-rich repeat (LRR) protein
MRERNLIQIKTDGDENDLPSVGEAEARQAGDTFIHRRTPHWIKEASVADIRTLRALVTSHKASEESVAAATASALPLHQFALNTFSAALAGILPRGQTLSTLMWQRKVRTLEGSTVPWLETEYQMEPGLLRLMQNFAHGVTPLEGSGLVAPGTTTVLSGDLETLIGICRTLDAGAQYQALLDSTFTTHSALLVKDKLEGFKLAVHLAFLKKTIDGDVRRALEAYISSVAAGIPGQTLPAQAGDDQALTAYPGLMSMLKVTVHGALLIQLRGAEDEDKGVVIYLSGEQEDPLRWYPSTQDWVKAMAISLQDETRQATLLQSIALADRVAFIKTLQLRLADEVPDLEVEGETYHDSVFQHWIDAQLKRMKADAELLLVPTSAADAKASRERLEQWTSLGWGLVNLAGLTVPVVGALLLSQLVVQVCSQVFEGAADWAKGHDHEALQHVLGVAETVAAAAAIGGGVAATQAVASTIARSAFVDGLAPVTTGIDTQRLWNPDLSVYRTPAEGATLADNGLYSDGERHFVRLDGHCYQVHRTEVNGPWRLQHPLRPTAYGPIVVGNGERSWHLREEVPQAWSDEAKMLDRLWPQAQPVDPLRARQVLQAACSDADELRGILVENRALPANLRDTLRRFEADGRVTRFFAEPAATASKFEDQDLRAWCTQHLALTTVDSDQLNAAFEENATQLRQALFTHLTQVDPSADTVAQVIQRDFAGLPPDYLTELAIALTAPEREEIELRRRLPLSVSKKARSLLQLARLSRAQQGLMLRHAYCDVAGELAFHLLPRVDNWAYSGRLELRENTPSGRLLAVLNSQAAEAEQKILVHSEGQFDLYDYRGVRLEDQASEPDDFFRAICALLSTQQQTSLGLSGCQSADTLRQRLLNTLPDKRQKLLNVLGWIEDEGWVNPGQRLPDGRVGYPLGGRTSTESGMYQRLRRRLSALYRGDSPRQLDEHVYRIMQSDDPLEALLFEERNYELLNARLGEWIAGAPEPERPARQQLTQRLRSAWRRQLDIDTEHHPGRGHILDMSGCRVTTLPEMSAELDFHFVTSIVMVNSSLQAVPDAFFVCFRGLRRLNLSRNNLQTLPEGIRHLTQLERLQLSYNRIRLDEQATNTLGELPQIISLDLSFNPLRALTLRFAQVPSLRRLHLIRCGLLEWPVGLEHCGSLRVVNLSSNVLTSVPDAVVSMPYTFRAAINLDRNAIPRLQLERLYARAPHRAHDPFVMPGELLSTRRAWMTDERAEERGALWSRLFPASSGDQQEDSLLQILSKLQESADFRNKAQREVLTAQVWNMLDAMDADPELAQQIRGIASQPVTCADSVAERFAGLQVQVLVAQAEKSAPGNGDELLKLGAGLFRLDKLEAFIREDLEARAESEPDLDLIEARLYYIVNLAKEMQLPGQPGSMRFATYSRGTESMLVKARASIKAAETNEAKAGFLSEQTFWSKWLQAQYPADFKAIHDEYDDLGSELDDLRDTLSDQLYRERWEALSNAKAAQLSRLKQVLTKPLLGGAEPADGQTGHPV